MIPKARIQKLNEIGVKNNTFGLYWMQRSQRVENNHALEYAVRKSNNLNIPLVVLFVLFDDYPYSNRRHFKFMLEGLKETQKKLEDMEIKMTITRSEQKSKLKKIFDMSAFVVFDKGYLKYEKKIRKNMLKYVNSFALEIESDLIVPVEAVSEKEEYAAYTIRKKINNKLGRFLKPLNKTYPNKSSLDLKLNSMKIESVDSFLEKLKLKREAKDKLVLKGGREEALQKLNTFIESKLNNYAQLSNHPEKNYVSNLSPYLHFGQISPLFIAKQIDKSSADNKDKESFLEQLIIRRELSFNFVYYNTSYDSLDSLPEWAFETLMKHKEDKRDYTYSYKDFENGETHDKYWNAAQKEMKIKGIMSNYMRMYWGKKVLEWTSSPEEAFKILIKLNNKYELDGRDPNSYAGIAWCFGKHDRAWKEREIYGKVRYMSKSGLERKFDIDSYVKQIEDLKNSG